MLMGIFHLPALRQCGREYLSHGQSGLPFSMGKITPVSLFAHMMLTTAVSFEKRLFVKLHVEPPIAGNRQLSNDTTSFR